MKKETEKWLLKAKEDLADTEFNINGGHDSLGVFMLQQVSEKALKALHIENFGKYEFTYNLVRLSSKFNTPDKFQKTLEELTPVYTGFRYPDISGEEIEDPEGKLPLTKEIIEWIEKQLTK